MRKIPFIPEKTKPSEILDGFIWRHFLGSNPHNLPDGHKVGQGLNELGPEARAIISELKSDDLVNIRPDLAMIGPVSDWEYKRKLSRDKLNFDKKVLKIFCNK